MAPRSVPDGKTVLTHCNAGALATAGYGTALGVIRAAVESGKKIDVFADETRPFLQGARLTAWELQQDGIATTLITDNMAGHFLRSGRVGCVVVGADRIAGNGDVANKIGTYSVAVLAKENGIPFYVAAPTSTPTLRSNRAIKFPSSSVRPRRSRTSSAFPCAPPGNIGIARRESGVRRHSRALRHGDHLRKRRRARSVPGIASCYFGLMRKLVFIVCLLAAMASGPSPFRPPRSRDFRCPTPVSLSTISPWITAESAGLLLAFRRTDCPHCKALSKLLESEKGKFGAKFAVLGVVIAPPDNQATVKGYIAETKITNPIVFDQGQVALA